MPLEDGVLERAGREAVADQGEPAHEALQLCTEIADRLAAVGINEVVVRFERLLPLAPDVAGDRPAAFERGDSQVAMQDDALGEQPLEDGRASRGPQKAADGPLGGNDVDLLA